MSRTLDLTSGRALHAAHDLGQHDLSTAAPLPAPERGGCAICHKTIDGPGRISRGYGKICESSFQ
jgi:hypothetical protein